VAALDPQRIATFWAELLGWRLEQRDDDPWVIPPQDNGFRLHLHRTDTPKSVENLMHFDITSESLEDQAAKVAKVLELGGGHYDVGQRPDEGHVVVADPEANAFCIVGPGNDFLAGTGLVGALSSDGSPEVGRFWSAALGWPLVWDQDDETAIQSPAGGSKISWGGPPYGSRAGADRWTYELTTDDRLAEEVDRLAGLGARVIERRAGGAALADPDDNRFTLRAATG
jgi:catechol 2,3-dioxygenase-like lactoylglutathione lyase family enzyme